MVTFSGGSNGDGGPGIVPEIRLQIQLLLDEIAALRAIPVGDPRSADAVRIMQVKQRSITYLRRFLPSVQGAINALPSAYEDRGGRS